MAELNIAPATGSQNVTQNPQTVPAAQTIGGASAKSGGVQPGTAQAILTSQNGVSLGGSAVTTVNLTTGAGSGVRAQQPAQMAKQPAHHINGALIGISIVLVVIAVGLFWAIGRSAKNTTNYS